MDAIPPNATTDNTEQERTDPNESPKGKLAEFIAEALQLEKSERRAQQKTFSGVAFEWPAWPYLDYGTIGAAVSKDLGDPDDSIREIRWRLKQFRYPYEADQNKVKMPDNRTTFYQHAKSGKVLNALLEPPLLWDIRSFWWSQTYNKREEQLKKEKKSSYKLPLALHREHLFKLAAQLTELERLLNQHKSKKNKETKEWFARLQEGRPALLKRILNEAAIVYPRLQYDLTPSTQLKKSEEKIAAQVGLFTKLSSVAKKPAVLSQTLAYHLTSLICTPREIILKRRLFPTPETVRRNIETWMKTVKKP